MVALKTYLQECRQRLVYRLANVRYNQQQSYLINILQEVYEANFNDRMRKSDQIIDRLDTIINKSKGDMCFGKINKCNSKIDELLQIYDASKDEMKSLSSLL